MTGQKKNRNIRRSLACLSVAILIGSKAPAQWSVPDLPQYKLLHRASEQFFNGHYAVAAQSAHAYLNGPKDNTGNQPMSAREEAQYYIILSALKLSDATATDTAKSFLATTGNPVHKQRVAHALAQYYFSRNELATAIPYYELAGIANLSNEEIVDVKFEMAYCYFNNRQFDKATPMFAAIKELAGKYNTAGNYYYGLLAYNQGDYQNALRSFDRIKEDKEYYNIVPYYIAEIHYFMGNKKQALTDALQLTKRKEKLYYDKELHLLAAQVLFEEQRYGEALPYFEHYYDNTEQIRKEDIYEMGYSYYRVNEWPNAIEKFKHLSNTQDTLGQTAMYLLGDCYLKTGDKKSARNAFSFCADMPFNPGQREAALILSARLSYEQGYYDDAISRINALLKDYPRSAYKDEAKTLMSDILIKTNNYEEAYASLQGVANKDALYKLVYQKVTYGYAMQQMQNGNIDMADNLLGLSVKQPVDESYEAAANFWRGEIAYRQQNYAGALVYTHQYINKAASNKKQIERLSPTATMHHAYLNMGYASLEQKDFTAAQSYFSHAQQSPDAGSNMAGNAMLREADAVFMQKDFGRALGLYEKVIAANGPDADYAKFQKATILGIAGKNAEKQTLLQSLISSTPPSPYADDARYELGLLYIERNEYQQAITALQPLITQTGRRALAPKALIRTAFSYQQLDNDIKAIESYRQVVNNYPASEERQAAMDALKSLYIETNQPAAYAQMLKDNNIPGSNDATIDSAYYVAAEAQFAAGRYDKAKLAMQQYLKQYPTGQFTTKANYYTAESHYQLKEYNEALAAYAAVLDMPWSDYTENSARKASAIAFSNTDYSKAASYYRLLRSAAMDKETLQQAYYGLMESNYRLNNKDLAIAYADTLSGLPGVNESMLQDAQLYKARALQQSGKQEEAAALYKTLSASRKSALASEARYQIAAIYLEQGKLKEAEDAANTTIRLSGSNDYWIVRSYITLADILMKQQDYFNAKATLQSIIKNTKNTELKEEANKKLEQVKALEKKQSKLSD